MMVRDRGFVLGVDLGQKRDYTAIAVLEKRTVLGPGRDRVTWEREARHEGLLRHLERLPLGVPYTEAVREVVSLADRLQADAPCTVVVDETGVGVAVVDLLKEKQAKWRLAAVTITAGEKARRAGSCQYRVPKRDLVSKLQVMFEKGTLHIAEALAEGECLRRELAAFQVRVAASGHESYEAWREGAHDDLVLATALACWWPY